MEESAVIRKNPIVIIKDLIVVQFIGVLAFLILAVLGNYEELYKHLSFAQKLSYDVARFIFIILAQIILMGYVFLKWLFNTYTIYKDYIIYEKGVILKDKKKIPLGKNASVRIYYSKLSRILKYGTVIIDDTAFKKPLHLPYLTNPEDCARLILDLKTKKTPEDIFENVEDFLKLLKKGENEKLELKSSFRWDINGNKLNKGIEHAIMKTIAAFLNTQGGHLIIGVGNNKEIIGLEYDYKTLPNQNTDTFENHFNNVFKNMIGAEHRLFVKLTFHSIDGKDICVIKVLPSDKPAYFRAENSEMFYIRTGNSTTALKLSEATPYIQSRWQKL